VLLKRAAILPMNCCPKCFAHKWLKQYIFDNSTLKGRCDYCSAREVPLISIGALAPRFDAMMGLYRDLTADTILPYENPLRVGIPLLDLVQEWGVFSERVIRADHAKALLKHLANYGWDDDSGEPKFNTIDLYTSRVSWSHSTLEEALDGLIRDLGEDPDDPDIPAKLGDALAEHLGVLQRRVSKGAIFYRGRHGCQASGEPYEGTAIGAPFPPQPAGRANRAGAPALYVARNERTATAELRARTPEGPLSMCRLRAVRDLSVIDIVRRHPGINPFTTSEDLLGWKIEIAELLNLFSDELSQPVQSDDDPLEYRVTQQLSEAVRATGYNGICYPSTRQTDGVNLVVFDPGLCRLGSSWLIP